MYHWIVFDSEYNRVTQISIKTEKVTVISESSFMLLLSQFLSPLNPQEITTALIIRHSAFIWPVPELHKGGIKQNVLLSGRLLSLSQMFPRFAQLSIVVLFYCQVIFPCMNKYTDVS